MPGDTSKGYKVHLLSPNRDTTKDLSSNVKRDNSGLFKWFRNIGKPQIGQTVRGFVYRQVERSKSPLAFLSHGKHVAVIDNAHKLSADDLNVLLNLSQKDGTHLVFLNNAKGLIGSHNALDLLSKANVPSSTIQTGDYSNKLVMGLCTQSMKLDLATGNTLVVTDSKRRIAPLTQEVRNELKYQGKLSREEIVITGLKPKYIKQGRITTSDFEQGNRLRLYHRDRPFEDFKVRGSIAGEGVLSVETLSGRSRKLRLKELRDGNFKLFESSELKIARGDRVRGTATMQKEGIETSVNYRVIDVNDKYMVLSNGDKQLKLSSKHAHLPLEHDYVRTISQAAGSFDKVILDAKAYSISSNLINELSAIASNIDIHTDDVSKAERVIHKAVHRQSATNLVLNTRTEPQVLDCSNIEAFKKTLSDTVESLVTVQSRDELSKALDQVIDHLSEREAAFGFDAVFNELANLKMGKVGFDDLKAAIKEHLSNGELVKGSGGLFTTPKALAFENSTIDNINAGKSKLTPIMESDSVRVSLEGSYLTSSQKDAVNMILSSKDQFVAVQGFAGTGKSTLLNAVQNISGTKILGLAPTHRAVFELQEKGLTAQTLQSFLRDYRHSNIDLTDKLVVLDEASMVSNQDMAHFTKLMQKAGSRVVIQGDLLQYQSIASGKPWDVILAKSNIDRVYCNDIVRQESKDTKAAVESIIAGDVSGALEKINNAPTSVERTSSGTAISERCGHNVVEMSDINHYSEAGESDAIDTLRLNPPYNAKSIQELDRLGVLEAAANDYLSRSLDERNKTIVIVDAHADREIIHNKIRDGLKQQGCLAQEGVAATRLVSLGLTQGALHDINIFETSQVVGVNGQHCTICDVDKAAGSITLEDTYGNTSILVPEQTNKRIELYELKQVELCQGDIIRSTRTDKARGIVAGTQYQVMETNSATIKLANLNNQNERTLTLNDLQDAHWDYAYSATGYSAQGSTCQSVIDVKLSWRSNLSSMRALYVSISRAINNVTVYTDSKEELIKRLNKSKSTNNKTAAIEAVSGRAITPSVSDEQTQDQQAEVKTNANHKHLVDPKMQTHNHQAGHSKAVNPAGAADESQNRQRQSIDANALQLALANDVREVATSILGEPNQKLSNASNLRFGSKGSMSVNIAGKHQGKFHNFETGESGNMIQLIQNELGLEFKEALEYGQRMVGGALLHFQVQPKAKSKPIVDNQSSKTAKWAARIIDTAQPIKGTLAERYLKEHRRINKVSGKDLKFHPKVFVGKDAQTGKSAYAPALVAIARDIAGKDLSAQVTYLDKETANKLNTDIQKRTLGKITGKAVTLSGSKANQAISFIAEGVETGLSVQEAVKGAHVLASLGKQNMKNIDPQLLADQVILIADNDGKSLKEDKQLLEAASRFKHAGKDVHIVMPESIGAKTDLNDILRAKGVDGLQQTLAATVTVDENRSSTDHALYDRKGIKQFNSNNTPESGAEREVMQRYHDMAHKQQHAIDKLQQPLHGDVKPDHSAAQMDRQVQIDREI